MTNFIFCLFLVLFNATAFAQTDLQDLEVVDSAGEYDLVRIPTAEVDKYMKSMHEDPEFPEFLSGLWWMDGNPFQDDVLSFAGSKCDLANNTFDVPVFDEKIWSWYDTPEGINLYKKVHGNHLVYRVKIENDKRISAVPVIKVFGFEVPAPKALVDFEAHQPGEDPNNWIRDSYALGMNFHNYNLRRIVDGKGNRIEENFQEFVEKRPKHILIARKKK